MQKLIAMDWETLIPGHPGAGGRLGTKQDAKDQLAFFQDASREVQKAAREGKCWDGVETELKLPKYAAWVVTKITCRSCCGATVGFGVGAPEARA